MPRPHGHECQRLNVCFNCQGRLRARRLDGFSEIMYDDGQRAFAAAVCRLCKLIHNELIEGLMPIDFDKRLEKLRETYARTPANYAITVWSKTVEADDKLVTREYCMAIDGSVVTRLESCDTRRSFHSFESDGWKPHTVKGEYKGNRELLRRIDEALTKQGYRRLF